VKVAKVVLITGFIHTLTEDDKFTPGYTPEAATNSVSSVKWETTVDGEATTFLLVDTPGCTDGGFEAVAKWLNQNQRISDDPDVTGVLYFHSLDLGARWDSKDDKPLGILRLFVGKGFLGNVVLATSKWDTAMMTTGGHKKKEMTFKRGQRHSI
jgi:hypothetical protein